MTFGEKLQMLRKEKGWTQEDLASQIHISRQALSKWEQGTATADTENVIALSKLFGVTTDYLLLEDYPRENVVSQPARKGSIQPFWFFAAMLCLGVTGNFTIYLLSRFIRVPIPVPAYPNNGEGIAMKVDTGHSYLYFLKYYDLELLAILLWVLVGIGAALLLWTWWRKKSKGCKR